MPFATMVATASCLIAGESADDFLDTVRHQVADLKLDRTAGQPKRLIIVCEAAGLAQLAAVAGPYGLPVIFAGRFESVTLRAPA
jgi:hypothetical protein